MVYKLRGIRVKCGWQHGMVLSEFVSRCRVPKAPGREREGRGSALPLVGGATR